MGLGNREKLFEGTGGWGLDFSMSPKSTDGFLQVVIQGKDEGYTYLTLVVRQTTGDQTAIGGVTWAYSAQQDFEKVASCTVPIQKGIGVTVAAIGKRKDSLLNCRIWWIPLL